MRTLLVGIDAKYIHTNPAIYSLAAYAERFAPGTGLLGTAEYTVNQEYSELLYGILREEPNAVCFSTYIWNVQTVRRLLRDLRRVRPQTRLILGGPEVSYGLGHTEIAEDDCDYVICGEGERAFAALLLTLAGREVPDDWGFETDGKRVWARPIENLDELPFFYEGRMELFRDRILYYEASRGCPYRCSYCLSAAEEGVRAKSAGKVLRELTYLVGNGAKLIKFLDRSFNARPELATVILSYLAALPEDCPTRFHFELEAETLTEPLLALFENLPAGRVQLEIGIQSTMSEALAAVHRNPSTEKLFRNIRRLVGSGRVKVHADLIAGLPYEDLGRFARSFSEAYELGCHELQLGFLKRLQGAPLAAEEGFGYVFSPAPPYELLKNDWLSPRDLGKLKRVEDCFDRFANSGRFVRFFAALAKEFDSAWELFETLADYLELRGLAFLPLGAQEEFELLAAFARKEPALLRELLQDFYAFTSSDRLPEGLAPLAARPENAAELSLELLRSANARDRKLVTRFTEGGAALWDYTAKDPVTGRYAPFEAGR